MNLQKALLLCLVAAVGGGIALTIRARTNKTRAALAQKSAVLKESGNRVVELNAELDRLKQMVASAKPRLKHVTAATIAAESSLDEAHPDSRWAEPPSTWPEWNPDSPYVWVRKEMLPRLPLPSFTATGELDPGMGEVLALRPAEEVELGARLRDCLERYRAEETNRIEMGDEHLPGIAGQDGEKRTIRVLPQPEAARKARAEFDLVLDVMLGEQRAALVRQRGGGWMDAQFSVSETQPKTISLLRRPDGSFNVSTRSGNGWTSTGMPREYADRIRHHIPPHLLPYFADMLPSDPPPGWSDSQ